MNCIADAETSQHEYYQDRIKLNALHLRPYVQDEHLVTLVGIAHGRDISPHLLQRIQDWTLRDTIQTLWVQAPMGIATPSQYTLISACIIERARQAGFPVAFYFGQPNNDFHPDDHEEEDVRDNGLIRMIYSLIAQILEFIPQRFHSGLDFSGSRFSYLDGTTTSLTEAICVLKNLMTVAPHMLFCIVDGLQLLEGDVDGSKAAFLKQCVEILQGLGMSEARKPRTFFTIHGRSDALAQSNSSESVGPPKKEDVNEAKSVGAMEQDFLEFLEEE